MKLEDVHIPVLRSIRTHDLVNQNVRFDPKTSAKWLTTLAMCEMMVSIRRTENCHGACLLSYSIILIVNPIYQDQGGGVLIPGLGMYGYLCDFKLVGQTVHFEKVQKRNLGVSCFVIDAAAKNP